MTQQDAKELISNQKEQLEDMNELLRDKNLELIERPTRTIVETVEVVVTNSEMGGENLGGLFGALSLCQGEFTSVKKGSSAHSYNYADIEAVLKAVTPITSKNGISISQMNVSKMHGKTPLVGVKTVLGHKDGGWISSEVYIPVAKTKMNTLVQMAGVTITYLRRYGIQSALGLSTTDNDGKDD